MMADDFKRILEEQQPHAHRGVRIFFEIFYFLLGCIDSLLESRTVQVAQYADCGQEQEDRYCCLEPILGKDLE